MRMNVAHATRPDIPMSPSIVGSGLPTDESRQDTVYSWYALSILTLSYALAYVDRQLLNLLVDPVKRTLAIDDTQFSFIQGFAFISAYIMAAPIFGRLVDITNRRNILIAGVCTWSIFTVVCGTANSFWELAIARFGVGISEACVYPVAMSLIPELFSTRRLPRALSIFALGTQIGGGFSLLAGGAVIAFAATVIAWIPALSLLQTWQLSFVMIGLPGLALALLLLSIHEPARSTGLDEAIVAKPYTLSQSFGTLWKKRAFYGRLYLFAAASGVVFLCIPAWFPTFMIRVLHVPAATVGWQIGIVTLLCGGAGTLFGPWLSRILAARGYQDSALRAAAIAYAGAFLFCAAIPGAQSQYSALAVVAGIIFCCAVPTSLIAFSLQRTTPGPMRGMVASFYTLTIQTIGYGVGPTAVALVTEHVFGDPLRVGSSLSCVCCVAAAIGLAALLSNLANFRRMIVESTAA